MFCKIMPIGTNYFHRYKFTIWHYFENMVSLNVSKSRKKKKKIQYNTRAKYASTGLQIKDYYYYFTDS